MAKLKYENAVKGYDRKQGLKKSLDEFTEVLMDKLFQKREPTDEFKYVLKKDHTLGRTDNSKPAYLDEIKRFLKLNEIGDKKKYILRDRKLEELKRA